MPDPTADTCQIAPPPAGPYFSCLSEKDREIYETTTDDPDLAHEIRLMRLLLAKLSEKIPDDHRAMSAILSVLIRAVSLQATKLAHAIEDERMASEEGEQVLQILQRKSDSI